MSEHKYGGRALVHDLMIWVPWLSDSATLGPKPAMHTLMLLLPEMPPETATQEIQKSLNKCSSIMHFYSQAWKCVKITIPTLQVLSSHDQRSFKSTNECSEPGKIFCSAQPLTARHKFMLF